MGGGGRGKLHCGYLNSFFPISHLTYAAQLYIPSIKSNRSSVKASLQPAIFKLLRV